MKESNKEDIIGGCPFCHSKLYYDESEGMFICFECPKSFEIQCYDDRTYIVYNDAILISQEEYDNR